MACASRGSDASIDVPCNGVCIPFVDPALPAPAAALCWLACPAAARLEACATRAVDAAQTAIAVAELGSAHHVLIGPAGEEYLLLRDSSKALTLRLYGSRAAVGPIAATFLVDANEHAPTAVAAVRSATDLLFRPQHRTMRTRERLLMRDALIALDAQCAGAGLRQTACLIHGDDLVRLEWPGEGGWLKERMRRARARGVRLRDGGYRKLLQEGCCCSA